MEPQDYNGTFLSADEYSRFCYAGFFVYGASKEGNVISSDFPRGVDDSSVLPWLCDPFDVTMEAIEEGDEDEEEEIGCELFTQMVLMVTLELYHEVREWLIFFYCAALFNSDESCDAALDYLLHSPPDMTAFILKAIREMEDEMTEQIAANFAYTTYTLTDLATTRQFFAHLYGDVRPRLTAVRNGVEHRRLLL
jgi:hypothetical protein